MKDVRFVFEEDEEDEEEEKAKNRHLRADLQSLSAATVSEGTHHSQPQNVVPANHSLCLVVGFLRRMYPLGLIQSKSTCRC